MVQNRIFGLLRNNHIFYYPIICYRRIKFYRVETMDMGISHWYNGVTGMIIISVTTMVNIIRDMILW